MRRVTLVITLSLSAAALADDIQQVDTTHIRANKELPKVLYVVPWKDVSSRKNTEQKLVLPELFGNLYDPLLPDKLAKVTLSQQDKVQ